MKSLAVLLILLAAIFWSRPAKALDPATVSAAAPQALELAAIWSPHAASTMQSCGIGMLRIGESMVSLFYLPLGVIQCTLGAPFGYFSSGIDSIVRGGTAPFIMVYEIILLPVRLISLGTVR